MLSILLAVLALAPPPLPPPPPTDIAALIGAAPSDAARAKRMLTENGVPMPRRTEALAFLAGEQKRSKSAVLLDAVVECAGACGGVRDLADALVASHAEVQADAELKERVLKMSADMALPAPVRMAAYRTVCQFPADARPDAAKGFSVRTISIKTVAGVMQYDVKELKAKPGEALEIVLENADSMRHNFLLVAPGKLAEAGLAGDKMGETPEGNARQFVPDSPIVLEAMGLVDPGKTGHMFLFAPDKPGTYPYVCTYPAHWRMMNGKLKVQAPAASQP